MCEYVPKNTRLVTDLPCFKNLTMCVKSIFPSRFLFSFPGYLTFGFFLCFLERFEYFKSIKFRYKRNFLDWNNLTRHENSTSTRGVYFSFMLRKSIAIRMNTQGATLYTLWHPLAMQVSALMRQLSVHLVVQGVQIVS